MRTDKLFADPIHFIGICGSGMSGLAELADNMGYQVQGSDTSTNDALPNKRNPNITIKFGHSPSHLGSAKTVVYSSAIPKNNPELIAAKDLGLNILHRSEFLAQMMNPYKSITVAGTHGKSTTSGMLTHVLLQLGTQPCAVIGGKLTQYDSSQMFGRGQLFVAEADESDGSFLRYHPHIGVVTNIDSEGFAIINWDDQNSRKIADITHCGRITFGFTIGSDVRAINPAAKDGTMLFTAIVERDKIPITMSLMGTHNILNALCTLSVVRALNLDIEKAAIAIASFAGLHRRMHLVFERQHVRIYDDYAHNPGKMTASISALKNSFPNHELCVVYQPHRYSRLETMYNAMLDSVKGADKLYICPVYAAGETTKFDFSPQKIARDIAPKFNGYVEGFSDFESIVDKIYQSLKNPMVVPTIILTLGAGDVWQVAQKLKVRMVATPLPLNLQD